MINSIFTWFDSFKGENFIYTSKMNRQKVSIITFVIDLLYNDNKSILHNF